MINEEEKVSGKAIEKVDVTAKSVNKVPADNVHVSYVPGVHVFSSIDVLMDNLRRNYVKNIYYPWDASLEPVIAVPKAATAISAFHKRTFPSTF
jgi:hypothetical protein